MSNPMISIIVPIYRVEKYLKECVDSILAQTYKNFELILVDDGSPDNCPAICDGYAKQDDRVVVVHKKNGGLSDARNAGLDIAKGEYIGFVDSDDYISPIMYETLMNRIISDQSDIVICEYICVDESGEIIDNNKSHRKIQSRCYLQNDFITEIAVLYGDNYLIAWDKLYRKEIFNSLRFPIGKLHEDAFTFHHIIEKCGKISYIRDRLYYYRIREGSIMTKKFDVRRLDFGDALIDRYYFTKKKKFTQWKNETAYILSHELEKWNVYAKDDAKIQKRYNELRKKSWFLLFEKDAWRTYNSHGRLYMKFQLIMPKVAEFIRKLYNK